MSDFPEREATQEVSMAIVPEETPIPETRPDALLEAVAQEKSRVAVLLASDLLGSGPDELGRVLIRSFVKTLKEVAPKPWRVIIINSGVQLALDGSPVLGDLIALEETGVDLLSCGTCLDYFKAKDRLKAGRVSNMLEIVTTLTTADRVVRP
jgi:selenium metabolism protein YedF